jgi:predicted nucleic acid-binding protein
LRAQAVSRFILDASIVLTWCFPDEKAQKAQEISERIARGDSVIVPAFWRHEVLNALLVGEKRNRLTPELTQGFIADLNRLPIEIDAGTQDIVFHIHGEISDFIADTEKIGSRGGGNRTRRRQPTFMRSCGGRVKSVKLLNCNNGPPFTPSAIWQFGR